LLCLGGVLEVARHEVVEVLDGLRAEVGWGWRHDGEDKVEDLFLVYYKLIEIAKSKVTKTPRALQFESCLVVEYESCAIVGCRTRGGTRRVYS
jgi:hypothetical protein